MLSAGLVSAGLLATTLAVTGCSPQADTPKADAPQAAAPQTAVTQESQSAGHGAHTHGTGPNGGVVFDLGKYHAEFTVDHPANECTVLFIDGDGPDAEPLPVAAEELTLSIKETEVKEGADTGKIVPPMTITLMPVDGEDGKASKFVGTDPGIGNVADFEGTVIGEIEGKPSQGTFKE
jgi:hypothetical protein